MTRVLPFFCKLVAAGGALVLLGAGGNGARAGDEPFRFFRSDGGQGGGRAGELPTQLGAPGVLRWSEPVDPGHSTPIVNAGRIYLTAYREAGAELATIALDARSGRLVWRRPVAVVQLESFHRLAGSAAQATPACDGERVYAFFGSHGLIAYDLEGRQVWEARMGPFQDEYGAGSSPVLLDDKVILLQDHDVGSFLVALDRRTGRVVWRVERPEAVRSYSTPVVWRGGGAAQLLVAGALELAAYDPADGRKLWWVNGLARIVIPVPVVSGEWVYMASWAPGGDAGRRLSLDEWAVAVGKWDRDRDGRLSRPEVGDPEVLDRFFRMDRDQSGDLEQSEWDRHAAVFRKARNSVLALRPAGRGELGAEVVAWSHAKGVPYVASPLVEGGIFWMVKDGGIVTKLEATTGRVLQEERLPAIGSYYASPVAGDGKIYFASESGTVSVVAASPEWKILASHDLKERIHATPVVDGGRLYVRTARAMYCFGTP